MSQLSPRTYTSLTTALLLALLALAALPACNGRVASTSERGAELRVRWVLPEAFPAQISLHRALRAQPSWQMKTFAAGERIEASASGLGGAGGGVLGEEIASGNLRVTLDEPQRVVVVLRNPLDRPVRFWVAPHLPTPHGAEPALIIRCLCTGETYEVPAHGTWMRVLELGIRRREAVDALVITHVVTLGEAPLVESLPPSTLAAHSMR